MKVTVIRKQTGEVFESETSDRIGFNRMLGYDLISKADFQSGHITMNADEEDFEILSGNGKLKTREEIVAQVQKMQNAATHKQIQYLISLGVQIQQDMTKQRASELIDAAKNGFLGSVNGFYSDGGN